MRTAKTKTAPIAIDRFCTVSFNSFHPIDQALAPYAGAPRRAGCCAVLELVSRALLIGINICHEIYRCDSCDAGILWPFQSHHP